MSAFIVPLYNHPALLELQDWLKTQVPEASEWVDPATFHITLVYSDEDMGAVQLPSLNLPMFGVGGMELDWMVTPDNTVVLYVSISKIPQLTHLQASVFYAVLAAGIKTSPFSWPGVYRPHVSLAYVPKEKWNERWISSPTQAYLHVDRFILSGQDYAEVANYPLMQATPGLETVAEMSTVREMMPWKFEGEPPAVAIAPDVDMKAILKDDPDPFFVTLPAFPVDKVSANKRVITRELAQSLVKQVNTEKPGGIMGHLKDEERDTEFPVPEVFWVGAAIHDDMGWVKGYVPPGQVREMLRTMKKVKSPVALSVYGTANHTWDKVRGAWVLSVMELETIDLAPPKRAGYGLTMVPHITAEMAGGQVLPVEEDSMSDKMTIIREMTAEDAKLLPDVIVKALTATTPEAQMVAEMRSKLGLDEKADVLTVVSEMNQRIVKMEEEALQSTIVSEVAEVIMPDAPTDAKGVQSVRSMVTALVKEAKPANADAVKGLVAEVAGRDYIQTMVANTVFAEMGGRQGSPLDRKTGEQNSAKFFDIPQDQPEGGK